MQRKVAYVFLYKNGIRERSVGILKRYGTAERPEVALELFGKEFLEKRWALYYFTKGGALVEASHLWGSGRKRGISQAKIVQCCLGAEAGDGDGIVLLPTEGKRHGKDGWKQEAEVKPEYATDAREFRECLCGCYDGKERSEKDLREAFCKKPDTDQRENSCAESVKRLMEEITKAAGGEPAEEQRKEATPMEERSVVICKSKERIIQTGPEKIMRTNPAYMPCRDGQVDYSVRITPGDLYCLPEGNKGYLENSFLLHGYYRYRHMLLGRRRKHAKVEYVLMVPGVYNGREAEVARLFGFPEFVPVTKRKPETGYTVSGKEGFGYFCGKI